MKKSIYLIAAAAMTLAGCSQDDLLDNGTTGTDGDAIAFESYLGKSAQTRATVVTTESLKGEGFTVDAYYTGAADFSAENPSEVFMKATKVTYNKDKGAWTYSPVKYWPNNAGDKVSFFAYGPYGNTNIKLNTETVSSIDFTVQNEVTDQVDFIYNNQTANSTLNQQKQTVDGKVRFQFQHALSRIAFTVAAAVDETSLGSVKLDGNSRINVKKVALVKGDVDTYTADAAGPFYKSGTLNMLDGTWSKLSEETLAFTFAGKKHFYRTVQDKDVVNPETDIDVVQLHKFNQKQRLLNDDSYLMIIPTDNTMEGTKISFKIYIEYDVITEDDDHADVSKITNCILSKDALAVDFEAGKAYNFNLILGMTSVKFDVDDVVDWIDEDNTDEWLPENETAALQGDGTEINPFLIYNAAQLASARDKINADKTYTAPESKAASRAGGVKYAEAYYKQMADIDLSECGEWTPIGNNSVKFNGNYDGNGHAIKGLTLNGTSSTERAGLFGYLSAKAKITGINIKDCTITGKSVGAVAGIMASGSTIEDCTVSGTFTDVQYAGGVASWNGNGTIRNCINNATFTGAQSTGGIVYNNGGDVVSCVNNGSVSGTSTIGGIAAYNELKIIACYNTADITNSGNKSGGIAADCKSTIVTSYNSGTVSGTENVGGIIGKIDGSSTTVTACYYKAGGSYFGIGSSSSDTDGQTAAVSGNDWGMAQVVMNNKLNDIYNDSGTSNKEWYNCQYTTDGSTATTPLTLKAGVADKITIGEFSGKGTADDPYLIWTVEQLKTVATNITNHENDIPDGGTEKWRYANYKLMADINLSSVCSENLGSWTNINYFNGTFDGNNKTISNYYLVVDGGYKGFINYLYGTVKSLRLQGKCVTAESVNGIYCGAIVGYNKESGTIIDCAFEGESQISGICGMNDGIMLGCVNYGNLTASDMVGGIACRGDGKIIGCINYGKVISTGDDAAGILSYMDKGAIIACYNTNAVKGDEAAASCGIVDVQLSGIVLACYNTGETSRGFARAIEGEIGYCYYENAEYGVWFTETVENQYEKIDFTDSSALESAMTTMNTAIANCGVEQAKGWSYEINTGENKATEPLVLKYTAPTE